jgi:hypothetical protein
VIETSGQFMAKLKETLEKEGVSVTAETLQEIETLVEEFKEEVFNDGYGCGANNSSC